MEHRLKHYVIDPAGDWNGKAVICLPGRGGSAKELAARYAKDRLMVRFKVIGIQPDKEWYPAPRGPEDQKEAVAGAIGAAVNLNNYILDLLRDLKVPNYKIALVGYSAGGVMALQAASLAGWNYPLVIVHSGCALDPATLRERTVKVHLYHAKDDCCFYWDQRYLPTKEALIQKGWQVECHERERGGHNLPDNDIYSAVTTIFTVLDDPD